MRASRKGIERTDWVPSEDNLAFANKIISELQEGRDWTLWNQEVTLNASILGEIFWVSLRDPGGYDYALPTSLWGSYPIFMAEAMGNLEILRKLAHLAQDRIFSQMATCI